MRICKVDGCNSKHHAHGFCCKHNHQKNRHGEILKRTIYDPNEFIIEDDICRINLFDKHGNEVAKAYDQAAIKYYGEFACTNKMMGLL